MNDVEDLVLCRPDPEPNPAVVDRHRAELHQAMNRSGRFGRRSMPPGGRLEAVLVGCAAIVVTMTCALAVMALTRDGPIQITATDAEGITDRRGQDSTDGIAQASDTSTTTSTVPTETTATVSQTEPDSEPFSTSTVPSPAPVWLYPTDVGLLDPAVTAENFGKEVLGWERVAVQQLGEAQDGEYQTLQIVHPDRGGQVLLTLKQDSFAGGWVITAINPFIVGPVNESLTLIMDVPANTEPAEILFEAANGESVEYSLDGDQLIVERAGGGVPNLVFAFVIYRQPDGFAYSAQGVLLQARSVNGGRLGLALDDANEVDQPPSDGSLVAESKDVAQVPTEAIPCQGASAEERPPNIGGDLIDGPSFDTPQEALSDFLARPESATLSKSGYIEMVGSDNSITYGAPFDQAGEDFVTLIRTEQRSEGWTATAWTASGC